MKARELMIGDWVIPHVFDSTLEPSKIVGIHYNSYKGKDYVDWVDCEVWDELSLNDIKPIPLTTDILEKNGFKWLVTCSKSTTYCINEPTIHVSKIKENEEWLICVGATGSTKKRFVEVSCVKYVHELQHALRLCGIEKEIEL